MPIRPISVTFFFTVYSFYEYVQSNQQNARDRKKILRNQSKLFFFNARLFFSARLFLVYQIKSLGLDSAAGNVRSLFETQRSIGRIEVNKNWCKAKHSMV